MLSHPPVDLLYSTIYVTIASASVPTAVTRNPGVRERARQAVWRSDVQEDEMRDSGRGSPDLTARVRRGFERRSVRDPLKRSFAVAEQVTMARISPRATGATTESPGRARGSDGTAHAPYRPLDSASWRTAR
jgi:hypothetical protein